MESMSVRRTAILALITAMSMILAWKHRIRLYRISVDPHTKQFMALFFYLYWFALVSVQGVGPQ